MSFRDDKTPMPAQPKTKEIPAVVPQVPATLDAVLREMRGMREETRARFEAQADMMVAFNQRLLNVEQRQENSSVRAREPSRHDIETKEELAKEREAREALAKEVGATKALLAENNQATAEIRDAVVKTAGTVGRILTHPKAVFIGKTLWAAAMFYAAARGLKVLP